MTIAPRGGKPVNVGDHTLRAQFIGTGGPTVVFENGGGSPSYVWALVQERLADVASTVTYDRAGVGWSEPRKGPASPAAVSAELEALLLALGAPLPWIVVAHSIGGLYAVDFCARHRDRVTGLVLVDSSTPDVYAKILGRLGKGRRFAQPFLAPAMAAADRLGLLTLMQRGSAEDPPAGMPVPTGWREAKNAFWRGRNRLLGNAAEIRALDETCDAVRPLDLGDLPLVVVSAGKPSAGFAKFWDVWESAQTDLLSLSTNSRQVVATESGHYVQVSDPDLVTSAIESLINGPHLDLQP